VIAQSTGAEAKATSPAELLTGKGKGKKIPGIKGHAAALVPASHKGATSFAHLMGAMLGAETGADVGATTDAKGLISSLMAAAAGLKNPARTALSALKENASGLDLPSLLGKILDESEKQLLAKVEKADGKKKPVKPTALRTDVLPDGVSETLKQGGAARADKQGEAPVAQAPDVTRAAGVPRTAPVIHVVDLRRKTADKASEAASAAQKVAQAGPAVKETASIFSQQQASLRDVEVPRKAAGTPAAAPQSGLERLREMAGTELLRASNLVLRDGGGEIRLVLRPESLGSVRIRMNVVDNRIEGRIIVDTSAVKQVMDQSIDALGRALTAGGFQSASLQVSVGGQNADRERQTQEPPTGVRRVVAEGFARNVPGVESLSMGDLLVNLFV
jgi:flagellar hook-length control protein FliK